MAEQEVSIAKFIAYAFVFLAAFAALVLLGALGGKALLMIAAGLATVFCAFMDYDWFMNSPKARPLLALFGRDGTRVVYIVFGIVIICVGLTLFFSTPSPHHSLSIR